MYELRTQKNNIRKQYSEKRETLADELRQERDARICELFLSLITYRYADTLLLYVPMKHEINVLPIAERALAAGKSVAFPLCDHATHTMEFRRVSSFSDLTSTGAFGIPEPDKSCPLASCGESSVCVVPAIVYDRRGYRLGYGKGFYDRYLVDFTGTRVGFAYGDFVVSSLPRGRFDLAVDVLVTERGVRAINANR